MTAEVKQIFWANIAEFLLEIGKLTFIGFVAGAIFSDIVDKEVFIIGGSIGCVVLTAGGILIRIVFRK
jgi:ABC-type antimicrobial peptide transport system permease subunit